MQAAAKNVRLRASLPGTNGAISIAFAQYGPRDVAFVSATDGLKTFDVTDLDQPKLLDHLTEQEMAPPGDRPTGNHIVSAVDPADLEVMSFHRQNTGHTSTCINDCQFLWTAGLARSDAKTGRIFVTVIRDPTR